MQQKGARLTSLENDVPGLLFIHREQPVFTRSVLAVRADCAPFHQSALTLTCGSQAGLRLSAMLSKTTLGRQPARLPNPLLLVALKLRQHSAKAGLADGMASVRSLCVVFLHRESGIQFTVCSALKKHLVQAGFSRHLL